MSSLIGALRESGRLASEITLPDLVGTTTTRAAAPAGAVKVGRAPAATALLPAVRVSVPPLVTLVEASLTMSEAFLVELKPYQQFL